MLLDILVDWLDDNLGQLGPNIYSGELDPKARYLLALRTPGDPNPVDVKRALRKYGKVASFKYLIDWPDEMQIYVLMPNTGVWAEQYFMVANDFATEIALKKANHPLFYSIQWDTSAGVEKAIEGFPLRDVLILAAIAVALVMVVRVNVGG